MLLLRGRVNLTNVLKRKFSSLPISKNFVITSEIKAAIRNQGPVVALESTIISHGNFQYICKRDSDAKL